MRPLEQVDKEIDRLVSDNEEALSSLYEEREDVSFEMTLTVAQAQELEDRYSAIDTNHFSYRDKRLFERPLAELTHRKMHEFLESISESI